MIFIFQPLSAHNTSQVRRLRRKKKRKVKLEDVSKQINQKEKEKGKRKEQNKPRRKPFESIKLDNIPFFILMRIEESTFLGGNVF